MRIRSSSAGPAKVLQFGVRDPSYPRNSRIREFLEDEYGAKVDVVVSPAIGRFARYREALRVAATIHPHYDLVILSEFSVEMFFASWIIARRSRAKHVVDFFVGLYETEVEDAQRTKPLSARALQLRLADWGAVKSAALCFTDTSVRARQFEKQFRSTPFFALPVGAPGWAAPSVSRVGQVASPHESITLLYYGNYLALHGVPALLHGIKWATSRTNVPVAACFVGDGPGRANAERLAIELEIEPAVTFVDPVPPDELAMIIADSDVVFGVFGSSSKAQGVIANKVWQGLYAGKTVITRASPALADLTPAGDLLLIEVDGLSPHEIGAAIVEAIAHMTVSSIGASGRAQSEAHARLESLVRSQYRLVFSEILVA